ncbi:MAG: hypothetical protein KF761_07110 [Salinibacterium sp.]|nr:hypothetical protein [Salinibacterium sp.]
MKKDIVNRTALLTEIRLNPTHTQFPKFINAASTVPDNTARAAEIIVSTSPNQGKDVALNTAHVNDSSVQEMVLSLAARNAVTRVTPIVEEATGSVTDAEGCLAEVEKFLEHRHERMNRVVTLAGGIKVTASDLPRLHAALRMDAARAQADGDNRHVESDKPGLPGLLGSLVLTGFESFGIYSLIANVSDLQGLIIFISMTGIVLFVNTFGLMLVGRTLRNWLQLAAARREAMTTGYLDIHSTTTEEGTIS